MSSFELRRTMQPVDDIRAVVNAIEHGHRFLVSAHARPDGDAIGSMLACGMILEKMGKQADLVICDVPSYRHLFYHFGVNHVWRVIKRGRVVHAA